MQLVLVIGNGKRAGPAPPYYSIERISANDLLLSSEKQSAPVLQTDTSAIRLWANAQNKDR
jgi:hypothetical protein